MRASKHTNKQVNASIDVMKKPTQRDSRVKMHIQKKKPRREEKKMKTNETFALSRRETIYTRHEAYE